MDIQKFFDEEGNLKIQEVYIEFRESVFHHILSIIKNYHDSEEVCNNVFLKMKRVCENDETKFNKNKSTLPTWIRTITRTLILDYFRTNHQDRYTPVSNFVSDSNENQDGLKVYFNFVAPKSSNADKKVLTDELQAKIVKAFHDLKPKYRRVAVLYFIREHEYGEIAKMLNVPMGTVKGMISRCRAKLQDSLKGEYILRKVKQIENV
jgi:RNA polymerase sigma factor (sigma-70 family)